MGDGGGFDAPRGGEFDSLPLLLVVIGDVDIGSFVGRGVNTGCFVGGGAFMDSNSSSQAV